MAIKINAGAAPKYGRLTMPKGTFLTAPQPKFSNPATRADGGSGGGSGENPPKYNPGTSPTSAGGYVLPQVPVQGGGGTGSTDQPVLDNNSWQNSFWNPRSPADFFFGVRGWFNSLPGNQPQEQQFYNAGGVPIQGYKNTEIWNGKEEVSYNPVAFDRQGNRYSWDANSNKYVRDETGALAQNPTQKTPNAPGNDLVGQNPDSAPNEMTANQASQLFPNLTPTQVAEQMRARGYESKYMPGVGGIWVKTSEPTQQPASGSGGGGASAVSNQVDNRGRPTWVDPTLLKPGERVTAASGLTFVGGTPTASGQAQYAITVPQSRAVAQDKHGDYKWQSYTKQDESGNWVRVYYKQLRKVRTAHGRRRIAQRRAEQQQQAAPAPTPQATGDSEALVTLRANYG